MHKHALKSQKDTLQETIKCREPFSLMVFVTQRSLNFLKKTNVQSWILRPKSFFTGTFSIFLVKALTWDCFSSCFPSLPRNSQNCKQKFFK